MLLIAISAKPPSDRRPCAYPVSSRSRDYGTCLPHTDVTAIVFWLYAIEQPHEDGPSYHPVVATLSVGSHAVFNYFRYNDDNDALTEQASAAPMNGKGRPIDPNPLTSVLLERRSLIITTGDLYTRHLHGIQSIEEDRFPDNVTAETTIANAALIGDTATRDVVLHGGTLKRGIRYSLTCRDVERVVNAAGLAIGRR